MFPADMTEQRKKLMATLAVVVNGLGNLESCCRPRARWPASRQLRRESEHYPWSARAAVDAGKGLATAGRPRSRRLDHAYGMLSGFMISEAYGRPGRRIRTAAVSEPLVVVGNGMAAARLVDELAKVALGRYAIAVIGDEPRLAYNRVLLSSVLAGETQSHDIELRPANWWRERGVTLKYGCTATEIDVGRRELKIANEESIAFSRLVLATGSIALRLERARRRPCRRPHFSRQPRCRSAAGAGGAKKRVVVVGGGLLGLEAAYGLAKAGAPVTLVHLMDRLMERQLDAPAADLLKSLVERKGIGSCSMPTPRVMHGETQVEGVELADGRRIEADAVIFAAGIRPNIALARDAGIAVNRGIIVDDQLQTGAPDIFALGECAEHRGICYGLVEPAYEQARGAGAASRRRRRSLWRQRGRDQSEGLRRQRVFRRRFHRRGRQRDHRAQRYQAAAPTGSW